MTTSQLVSFLKKQTVNASFTDTLKIVYRPYICPFDKILTMIEPGDAVADIGCGSGQLALLIAEFTKASRIVGIEINQRLIDNANTLLSKYKNLDKEFTIFDGNTFPTTIANCQKYFMVDVLHHVPKASQVSFLTKLYSLMQPESKLILKDINGASPFVYFNKLHDLIFAGEVGNELTVQTAAETLTKIGFIIESQTTQQLYVYPHYTIVAKK